jgi:hypothetical protein
MLGWAFSFGDCACSPPSVVSLLAPPGASNSPSRRANFRCWSLSRQHIRQPIRNLHPEVDLEGTEPVLIGKFLVLSFIGGAIMATEKKRDEVKRAPESKSPTKQAPSRQKSPATAKSGSKKPGSSGEGNYYHVGVQPSAGFETFRTQDVGEPGHIQRVAGKRGDGTWETVKWLIGKEDAHIEGDELIPDSAEAEKLLDELGAEPIHIEGDIFEAKPGGASRPSDAHARAGKTTSRTKNQPSHHK